MTFTGNKSFTLMIQVVFPIIDPIQLTTQVAPGNKPIQFTTQEGFDLTHDSDDFLNVDSINS